MTRVSYFSYFFKNANNVAQTTNLLYKRPGSAHNLIQDLSYGLGKLAPGSTG